MVSGCSASWSTGDGLLLGSFITAQGVDTAQTVEILNNPDYYERNPLIANEAALIALKVGSTATVVYLADKYPDFRTPILIIGNIIVWGIVGYNHSIGVRP